MPPKIYAGGSAPVAVRLEQGFEPGNRNEMAQRVGNIGAAPDRFIVKASLVTPEPPKPLKNARFATKRRSKTQMAAD
jgi:hypothetical protein